MTTSYRRTLALLALLTLLPAVPARSQDDDGPGARTLAERIPSGTRLGGRLVFYRPDDGKEGTWNPGVQARVRLSPIWAFEGSVDYQRHTFPGTTVHFFPVMASVLAYVYPRRISPFVLLGLGWYPGRIHGPQLRRNIGRVAPHFGFGADYFINKDWSVDATYRYAWLKDIPTHDEVTGAGRDFRAAGNMLTLGVNYRFEPGRRGGGANEAL